MTHLGEDLPMARAVKPPWRAHPVAVTVGSKRLPGDRGLRRAVRCHTPVPGALGQSGVLSHGSSVCPGTPASCRG